MPDNTNQESKKPAAPTTDLSSKRPASLAIAKGGIATVDSFTRLMSALMGDLIEGTVSAEVGNSVCKAGSNMLKAVEMQFKYGSAEPPAEQNRKKLTLTRA